MKRIQNFFLFYLILTFYNAHSQSITVEYKVQSNYQSNNSDVTNEAFSFFNKAYEILNSMKMYLKANSNESYYWGENKMSNDSDAENYKIAKIILEDKNIYHCELNKGIVSKWFYAYSNAFIVKDSISKTKWKFTKNKKMIGKYQCFEAKSSYKVTNSEGEFIKNVVAWYAPEISFRFGPKGFCNLPGLILELKDDKITYYVDNIKYNTEEVEIPVLPNGKIITETDLRLIGEKIKENSQWHRKSN